MRRASLLMVGALVALTACQKPENSTSTPSMARSADATTSPGVGHDWTYRAPDLDPSSYKKLIIEPAQVYRGPGSDYDGLSPAEVESMAQTLPEETVKLLQAKGYVADQPGPGVARLRFTVVRISRTVPYLSTATRVIPLSAMINVARTAAGVGGSLTGSATIMIEVFDSTTDALLAAGQRELNPDTFDIEATLGTDETARAVARQVAEEILRRIEKINGKS